MRAMIRPLAFAFAFAAAQARTPTAPADAFAGAWTYDAAATPAGAAGADAAPSDAPAAGRRDGRRGGPHGGGMGGGRGGGHRGDRSARPDASPPAGKEEAAERAEIGLSRLFATRVTITPLKQRIRFDDGRHAVELDRDGMNTSGPGVGGTVALAAAGPELVVETLTDSGYSLSERYRLAGDGRMELHASLKRPGDASPREFVRVFARPAAPAAPTTSAPTP